MKKQEYVNPQRLELFVLVLLIPLALMLPLALNLGNWILNSIFSLLMLCGVITIILWSIDTIKTVIEITENGILYKSLFKNISIQWNDIKSIERKYLTGIWFNLRGPFYMNNPIDLLIRTKDNNTVKILHNWRKRYVFTEITVDIENEIKKHTNIDIITPTLETRTLRADLIVGVISISLGVILILVRMKILSLISIGFLAVGVRFIGRYFLYYNYKKRKHP